jgi:glycine cleavage system aminomethyltransferase T
MEEIIVKQSPLYEAQKNLDAQFAKYDNWEMAQAYGDPRIEYNQVRMGVGLIDLSHHGAI